MTCMYAYFEYSDDQDEDVVQIETHAGFWTLDNPVWVSEYKKAHEKLGLIPR